MPPPAISAWPFIDHLDSPLEARMPRLPWRLDKLIDTGIDACVLQLEQPVEEQIFDPIEIVVDLRHTAFAKLSSNLRGGTRSIAKLENPRCYLVDEERGPPLITGAAEGNDIARGLRGKRGKFRGGFDPHELRDIVVELDDPELRIPDGHERGETAFLHRPLAHSQPKQRVFRRSRLVGLILRCCDGDLSPDCRA